MAVFGVTLLAGIVTGSSAAWAVAGLDGVALAAYVVLLVHLRRLAVEREQKLHYLDPVAARSARVDARRPTSAAATPTRRASRPSPADGPVRAVR